ncbi:histidine kinase [Arachnia rubra]|uniref:Signal transduction histidine kinase subgroup 3 dimerisation and phosphoacceptor domain-containing protein n=1 Tax=Arachnia rubra TaxID=1547448 RepID=A0ABX7Y6B9_9ACTN|nr:histidine kinase [Arachnia rubra]MBB1572263.1 hypothetical protein [Propionibacterium sp.]MBB1576925.1 hypothetical protein [Propionibacterium sp.]MDO4646907.1 histidine kinase [Propionibacteriaceae bacterium]QUC08403.1 hypothetical protein J5A65_01235 [Arachnia rubra]
MRTRSVVQPGRGWSWVINESRRVLVTPVIVVLVIAVLEIGFIWYQPETAASAQTLSTLLIIITTLAYVVVQARCMRAHATLPIALVGMAGIVAGVGAALLSEAWLMLGVAAATGLMLASHLRFLISMAMLLMIIGVTIILRIPWLSHIVEPVVAATIAIGLYTLTRAFQALHDLRVYQEELARLEVDRERNRISRDLHDVMGRTLVATSLRVETAIEMLGSEDEQVRKQLLQAQKVLATGGRELRSLTRGPVTTSLEEEVVAAQQLCQRLGIQFRCNVPEGTYASAQPISAEVVREGITNMLKHSRPRYCSLRIDPGNPTIMSISNDGCLHRRSASQTPGTGLSRLRQRLSEHSLMLEAAQHPRGVFELKVTQAPIRPQERTHGDKNPDSRGHRPGRGGLPSSP